MNTLSNKNKRTKNFQLWPTDSSQQKTQETVKRRKRIEKTCMVTRLPYLCLYTTQIKDEMFTEKRMPLCVM